MSGLYALAGPMLRALDAETAHNLTIRALAAGINPFRDRYDDPALAVDALGLRFANPLGIAAGFDKNAEVPDEMLAMGLGFAEVGTVTPLAQAGNPKPRLFRLEEDQAVINRMGFNNEGHPAALARLAARRGKGGIVGVNIGANKDSADRLEDYVKGLEAFAPLASYLAVNISSPNTPGLRGLQSRGELEELTGRLLAARRAGGWTTPLVIKIAPDLRRDELEDIAAVALDSGIDGLIVSNTTLARDGLTSARSSQAGGLSGVPLFTRSTAVLAQVYLLTGGKVPLIGVGGIASGAAAWQKIRAGASLIQLYTALVYDGPGLIGDICRHLSQQLKAHGLQRLEQATGGEADDWATRSIET